jgi:pescadillo protein
MKVFLNREVPQQWLEFCLVSFGAVVGWEGEGSPFAADDPTITHHIVDRPLKMDGMPVNRDYVQPQWVFDSINNGFLLPIDKYAPGKMLPVRVRAFVSLDHI